MSPEHTHVSPARALAARWLGVGLASVLAVVTLGLALTGRLGLYINPDSTWFAVGMSLVVLAGAALSFTLPLGAESDHGHDHGDGQHTTDAGGSGDASTRAATGGTRSAAHSPRRTLGTAATAVGGVAASGVVLLALVTPPATLSAELAMSRDVGTAPLFGGTDVVALATTGDTASFGVGEWAAVFATATNPDAFDGDPVTLTGFVTDGSSGGFDLTRLVITHCVIDAQPASLPVASTGEAGETGQWVTVTGTVRSTSEGLVIDAATVEQIDEPEDPYEF
ncbi:TIGR03943 family putative permease subunit [Microbacterium fluvii]|uniref:TIGR03943 family putative permease subunit n=1 Tax=Microbacterium fluvii TaxID=415215 RepID=A0ABW2HCS2_9MICO|nr:TIGR03943 family protein [Microbacterium fluvii]MCU4672687.1 TIGR03943 family protein [Microbacterium fluvii]